MQNQRSVYGSNTCKTTRDVKQLNQHTLGPFRRLGPPTLSMALSAEDLEIGMSLKMNMADLQLQEK